MIKKLAKIITFPHIRSKITFPLYIHELTLVALRSKIKPKKAPFILLLGLLAVGLILGVLFKFKFAPHAANPNAAKSFDEQLPSFFPEVDQISRAGKNFSDLKSYFQKLADAKGGVYAYEVLKRAPMPPNTDMHLLGHVVGEVLYKQKGAEGIKYCTQDFRNACSHTIVVGLLLEKGDQALDEIAQICKQAPGGSGAYTMCFHGLGHGVLSYTTYNMGKTVQLCQRTGTKEYNYREYGECVGGALMEQISGGDHDRQNWEKQRPVNLKSDDPLYPCNSDVIADPIVKTFCYTYITPHLFNVAGANFNGRPTDSTIKKAFTFCQKIPGDSPQDKKNCYGGFGKEFVVLAKDRDIRNIEVMNNKELKQIYDWCLYADDESGQNNCIETAVSSLFWGGENDAEVSLRFCSLLTDPHQSACFNSLIFQVHFYKNTPEFKQYICQRVPEQFSKRCLAN